MSKVITGKLARELRNTLDGNTWYDSNFATIINEIDADTAVKKLKDFPNSIVEIVVHMTQWKTFCVKKIAGDEAFDITVNSPEDWKRYNSLGKKEWEDIINRHSNATIELATALADVPDERLNDRVPGRKHSLFHLAIGVIEHEVAHMTQISYLKKLLIV